MLEFELIKRIQEKIGAHGKNTLLGIGDDAAILRRPEEGSLLFASDAMVEGVHFDFAYTSAEDLGHKAIAACLSDLAAMNGEPMACLVTLALPESRANASFIDAFYDGATAITKATGAEIVGGDLTKSKGGVFVDVACLGSSKLPLTRQGARPGDLLAVSGTPGASAAGLDSLRSQGREKTSQRLLEAHLRPTPRFDLIRTLPPGVATAMIDISDGLASETHHLAQRSNVGFKVEASHLPFAPEIKDRDQALEWCLNGGEDYELLVTFGSQFIDSLKGKAPKGFTLIGRAVSAAEGVKMREFNGTWAALRPRGFDHFRT